jgi:uncharacterized protein (DUF169 family)
VQWNDQILEIGELLRLEHTPVAVNYAVKLTTPQDAGKFLVCEGLLLASQGLSLDLSLDTLDCPTAARALGLGNLLKESQTQNLEATADQVDRLFCAEAEQPLQPFASVTPPLRLADHILIGPADRTPLCPDLILFICNAEQACRLIALDSFQTGVAPRLVMSGSTCHQAITYPFVTGELNLSLMDYVSRSVHGYLPQDLLVSVPYLRFEGIMSSLDLCTAGRLRAG